MKLFYFRGACSLAPHILLQEMGTKYELELYDPKNKEKILKYNPKGYVPTIVLDDGTVITEVAVILQYLADQQLEKNLIPRPNTKERYRCLEWLNFIATEVHKGFSPLFNKQYSSDAKAIATENLQKKLTFLDQHLAKNKYLLGDQYSVADMYCFVVVSWSRYLNLDISAHSNLMGLLERVKARPATQAAMQAENKKGVS